MKRNNKTEAVQSAVLSAILLLLVILVTLNSCTKEPQLSGDGQDKEYMDFSLELTPPGLFTAPTKAMTDGEQNAIARAEVLVFRNNILLYRSIGTVSDVDGVTRVKVTLKTSLSESDLFDIMVIGNSPGHFNFDTYVGQTKDALKAALSVSVAYQWRDINFVMYGEALQTLIKPTTNSFKIQMLRSLARVDVGVGAYDEVTDSWAGLADFSLTEVRVANTRDKFAAIPSATTFSSTGNVKVSEPTIPSGTTVQGKTAQTAIKYSDLDITAVDGKGIHTKSAIFIAEAPNTTDRVTLLVGGSYKDGATTYYRIDMCVPRAGAPGSYDYLNILRNHLYRISITSISGAGFTDPQEALISNPINITTTLTPIEEGSTGGDIVFDGNNYIMTDVSSVQIYGTTDGVKQYPIATVKVNCVPGVAATVTGPGINGTMNLVNGVSQPITAALPANTTTGSYKIKVGRLTKVIPITVQAAVDAHFDFLPFQNVTNITVEKPQSWLTLSNNMIYVKGEQQSTSITGNAQGKAVVHFDEYIATEGAPRTAEVLVLRNNNAGTTRVVLEQLNLSGMVMGLFGGAKDDYGYTRQLAVESVDEYKVRIYDDTSIGTVNDGMRWGFLSVATRVNDIELGKAGTIALAKRTDSGITGTLSIYNNYAARYCYDKNRDINGNGTIEDSEIVWYMPAKDQLMGAWIVHNGMSKPFIASIYRSISETTEANSWDFSFFDGGTSVGGKAVYYCVRCVRDLP